MVKSVYECLPTRKNLCQWGLSESDECGKCQGKETLEHVLCACKVALSEGRYTWRHNKVLEGLQETVHKCLSLNKIKTESEKIFVKQGEKRKPIVTLASTGVCLANEWEVHVDLIKRLIFPRDIVVTALRPDMVLVNRIRKLILIVELTVPWEERIDEAHDRKSLKY